MAIRLTIYNNVVGVCNGTFATTDYDEDFTSWTVGANYSFTDFMSAYVRVNRGGHFLDFDNGIRGSTTGNTPPMQVIRNYEGGFKFENDLFYADISAYFRDFTGLLYQPTDDAGAAVGDRIPYGSESKGINFIGAITPGENFRFQVVANYLDGEYTDYDACFPYSNVVTGDGCAPIEGQQLQRQPKLRYMLTPSYRMPIRLGRGLGLRHLHPRRRSHPGSVRAPATGDLRDLGFRHHGEHGRELAVFPARHERVR